MPSSQQPTGANEAIAPDTAAKSEQLNELEQTQSDLLARAAANGVDDVEGKLAAADKDWPRYNALKKVAPKIETASGDVQFEGHPDPGKFARFLDNAENKRQLIRALGEERRGRYARCRG